MSIIKSIINKKVITVSFFISGLLLLVLNIYGLFVPLKNPSIYNENQTSFENDTIYSPQQTFSLLKQTEKQYLGKDNEKYLYQVNYIFNQSLAHYWKDEGKTKYSITIPIYENYIFYALKYIYPSIYDKYQYCNYKKAIERGIGLCSQHAIALVDYLNRRHIEARVISLDGHVVATAEAAPDKWWILDPDFGVIIPNSLEQIEKSPEIVIPYYNDKRYKDNNITPEKMAEIYGKKGNIIHPKAKIGYVGYGDCNWKKVVIEKSSYVLKWIIPFFLIFPLIYAELIKNIKKGNLNKQNDKIKK